MTLVRARISKKALEHNLARVREHSGKSKVWGVVKANAYGHNFDTVLPVLTPLVEGLACARFDEALALKAKLAHYDLWPKPILILGGCYEDAEFMRSQAYNFQVVCHTSAQVECLKKLQTNNRLSSNKLHIWVELNIGMNRLGFSERDLLKQIEAINSLESVEVIGIMAHLGMADTPDFPENRRQLEKCIRMFQQVKAQWPYLQTSLSNSAHLFLQEEVIPFPWRDSEENWVRPGISLYGAAPFKDRSALSLGLKPVMTLEAQVVSVRDIEAGEPVGYGSTWQAPAKGRLIILAVGYGDGFPRHIENCHVICNGIKLIKAGRISMDLSGYYCSNEAMLSQQSSKCFNQINVGDYAELWGNTIHVDEVASQSMSIGYERLTQIKERVKYCLDD